MISIKDKVVIDTSAWIDYFEGTEKGRIVESFIEGKKGVVASIGLAEVADLMERKGKESTTAVRFIQSKCRIVPLTPSIALKAAKIKKEKRRKTNKFGLADAIHLATAHDQGAQLITLDKDFSGEQGATVL